MKFSIFKFLLLSFILIGHVEIGYAQTASILPPAKTTFLDNNGKPLVGGKVDFYIPGTTTRKLTWQDAGQTIPNTNPVVLDADGRAIILGDGSYRQRVTDKNGNVIWDQITSSTGSGGSGGTPTVGDGDTVGTIKAWSGITAPSQYVFAYGQEIVRASYPEAFAAITSQQNVSCTIGSPTLTGVGDTSQLPIGANIESSCLNSGATIVSKTVSTIVASSNAIISTATSARFFPFGNGDGNLTFKLPDLRGRVIAGRDNMGGIAANRLSSGYDSLGGAGGSSTVTIAQSGLPNISPTFNGTSGAVSVTSTSPNIITSSAIIGISASAGTSAYAMNSDATRGGQNSTGSFTPVGTISSINGNVTQTGTSVIQPTQTYNYIIKIIPDSNPNTFFGVASIGGMYGVLECGNGITCAGNTISAVNSTVPTPSAITLGGVFTITCSSSNWVHTLDNTGTFGCSQPNFTDLLGVASVTQGGTGQTSFTANLPIIGNGSGTLAQGTVTGTTTKFATSTGALTSGHCIQVDASGNLIDAGAACSTGGGSGTIYVLPSAYGALCDGVTNDAVALQNAINASVGKTLLIPAGICLTNSTLIIPSNIAITGVGRDISIVKSTANPAFSITSQSNISLSNFEILGTDAVTQWATSTSGPISLVGSGTNFKFTGMTFAGFNSNYWFYISTQGYVGTLSNITINNNHFISTVSDIPADADPTLNGNMFINLYSNTAGNGRIIDLDISNNFMDANSVCFGVINFANTYRFRISNNTIINPGVTTPIHCTNSLGATNAYGIAVYDLNDDGNPAIDGIVSENYILNPKAAGIYWVGSPSTVLGNNATNSSITNNLIVGETYSDTLLPRGAIVVASTTNVSVIGNTGYQNATCINLHGQNAGEVSAQSNHCESNAGGAIGLQLSALVSGTSNASRLDILSNYFSAPIAVQYQSSSTGKFNEVSLSNNTLVGSTSILSAANQFFNAVNNISNNSVRGVGTANVSSQTGGSTLLVNNLGFGTTLAGVTTPANGSSVFISDAAPGTNPCTAGAGAMALRQVGKWVCY